MDLWSFLDPVIIVGTLASITTSLALLILGVDTPQSMLFGLLGIIISLLLDLIAKNERLEFKVSQGIEVRTFDDGAKFINYFLKQVRTAKSIDDVRWGRQVQAATREAREVYGKYYDVIQEVASRREVKWREIIMFLDKSRFEEIRNYLAKDIPGYHIKYYPPASSALPPRFTFAIVDKEQLFISSEALRAAIRHPGLVQRFSLHYEDLWKNAMDLKHGKPVPEKQIENLEDISLDLS